MVSIVNEKMRFDEKRNVKIDSLCTPTKLKKRCRQLQHSTTISIARGRYPSRTSHTFFQSFCSYRTTLLMKIQQRQRCYTTPSKTLITPKRPCVKTFPTR